MIVYRGYNIHTNNAPGIRSQAHINFTHSQACKLAVLTLFSLYYCLRVWFPLHSLGDHVFASQGTLVIVVTFSSSRALRKPTTKNLTNKGRRTRVRLFTALTHN